MHHSLPVCVGVALPPHPCLCLPLLNHHLYSRACATHSDNQLDCMHESEFPISGPLILILYLVVVVVLMMNMLIASACSAVSD